MNVRKRQTMLCFCVAETNLLTIYLVFINPTKAKREMQDDDAYATPHGEEMYIKAKRSTNR